LGREWPRGARAGRIFDPRRAGNVPTFKSTPIRLVGGWDKPDHPRPSTKGKPPSRCVFLFRKRGRPQDRARATFSRYLLPRMLGRWVARLQAHHGRDIVSLRPGRANTWLLGSSIQPSGRVRSWLLNSAITATRAGRLQRITGGKIRNESGQVGHTPESRCVL
jgi:hypothetical protein